VVKNPGIDHHPVWTPEGSHLVFTSNRSHSFGLYAVAMKSGKPQGEPRLLKPEVGRTTLRSFAGAGTLYYIQTTSDQNIYKAELDPETGKLKGPAVPLATKYSGPNNMAALSPDGKFVAYLSDRKSVGGGPGSYTLIVKSLETDIERAFPTDLDVTDSPAWYADSRSLLIGTHSDPPVRGRTFYKLDVESGTVKLLMHFSGFAAASRWSLSRDGETLYMPGRNIEVSTVLALSLTTGQVKILYESPFDAERIDAVSLSPDGQTLAVAKAREIVLMDVNGGNVRALTKAWGYPGVAWSAVGKHVLFVDGENELWSIPATGGEPATTGLRLPALRSIAAEGASLTFSSGRVEKVELWAFDNLLPTLKAAR
jgi:Tol biopolymer transport system component